MPTRSSPNDMERRSRMRRIGLIALLIAALAAGAAAPAASAMPACTATVDPAWVVKDPVVGWMVGTNAVQAACDPAWRVALSPQYQTQDGLWHGGRRVFNHIYYPALTTYFDASSSQAVDLACCILYWDNGDGRRRSRRSASTPGASTPVSGPKPRPARRSSPTPTPIQRRPPAFPATLTERCIRRFGEVVRLQTVTQNGRHGDAGPVSTRRLTRHAHKTHRPRSRAFCRLGRSAGDRRRIIHAAPEASAEAHQPLPHPAWARSCELQPGAPRRRDPSLRRHDGPRLLRPYEPDGIDDDRPHPEDWIRLGLQLDRRRDARLGLGNAGRTAGDRPRVAAQPEHRAIVLSSRYHTIGIARSCGRFLGYSGACVWTADWVTRW